MLDKWLMEIRESIKKSPLRTTEKLPLKPPHEQLAAVDEKLESLHENLEHKLTLVLLGEVKAGKSTLINALAGDKVSPTDTLECTSSILEIEYGSTASAEICRHDGSAEQLSAADLFKLLEENRGNATFFERIRVIKVRYPLPRLRKLRLVDTPGLATITEKNERTTLQYLQKAHVILWLLNALTLGDSEVASRLSDVAKLGKPVVLIVNRIDQAETSPERLVEYVENEYGIYSRRVFALSAELAFKGVLAGDNLLQRESGLSDLLQYLEAEIEARHDDVKRQSVLSEAETVLRLETALNDGYLKQLEALRNQMQDYREKLALRRETVNANLANWLISRVHAPENGLLERERRQFLLHKPSDVRQIQERFTAGANRWWQETAKELAEKFAAEWEKSETDYLNELQKELGDYRVAYKLDKLFNEDSLGMVPKIVAGAAGGGVFGAGLAIYAASFPYITFAPAAGALIPAGAVLGAVVAVVNSILSKQRKIKELEHVVDSWIEDIRQEFLRIIEQYAVPIIKKNSEDISRELHKAFLNSVANGWQEGQIEDLTREIKLYEEELTEYRNVISAY